MIQVYAKRKMRRRDAKSALQESLSRRVTSTSWYSQQKTLLVFDFYLTPFSCSPCRAGTRVAPSNGFRFGNRITFICSSAAQYGPPFETISTGDSTLKQGERFGSLLQMYQDKTEGFLAIH